MTEHPDAEALSAYFDGEAPEWDEHVQACAECRRRLDAFRQVRSAVVAPVPPADVERQNAAIAAALEPDKPPARARSARWLALGGVAAVAIGALVGIVATRNTGGHQTPTAAGRAASGPVSAAYVDGGDLGAIDDATLRQKIEPQLRTVAGEAMAGAETGGGTAGGATSAGPGGAASDSASAQTVPASPRPTLPQDKGVRVPPCEQEARALQPGEEVLVYFATADWQGTPAVVLGFSPPGAPATGPGGRPAPTRVYVLSRSACRLLSFQSYAP